MVLPRSMQVLEAGVGNDAGYRNLSWWVRYYETVFTYAGRSWLRWLLWRNWSRYESSWGWLCRLRDCSFLILWVQAWPYSRQIMWIVLRVHSGATRSVLHVPMECNKRWSTRCLFQKRNQDWNSIVCWSKRVPSWRSYHVPPDLHQNLREVQASLCSGCQGIHGCTFIDDGTNETTS